MKPVLLIYIPTFNRYTSLRLCINRLIVEISGIEADVRIHVSDNNSSDETNEFLNSISHISFTHSKNSHNIGAARNYIGVYGYSNIAEYTLVIGDDDYVLSGAVKKIIFDVKNNLEVDIFFVNTISYSQDNYLPVLQCLNESGWRSCPLGGVLKSHIAGDFRLKFRDLFNPLIDEVLGGSLMCYIFRSSLVYDHISNRLDSIEAGSIYTSYPQVLNMIYSLHPSSPAAHLSVPVTCNFWHQGAEWGKDAYHRVVSQGLGFLLFELRRLNYIDEERFHHFFKHYLNISRESIIILLKQSNEDAKFNHELLCNIALELLLLYDK